MAELSWREGEKLTYEVHWGMVVAAEAVFSAKKDGPVWLLSLELKSRGVVEKVHPIRSRFTSRTQTGPWRSLGFEEDRAEGKKRFQSRTVLRENFSKGRHEDLSTGKVEEFPLPQTRMDDLGSLLYAIRMQDWRKERERLFIVYDGPKIKYGRARWVGKSRESVGIWPQQNLLLIEAWPEDENGKRKKGILKLWLTDDEKRLPLRSHLVAKFGTFEIDLVQAEGLPSSSPSGPTK